MTRLGWYTAPTGARPNLLGAALWYTQHDIPVFPLEPGGKRPATRHGCKDATTDPTRIRAWWQRAPDANIGIATGHHYDVVDIDGLTGQTSRDQHWDSIFAAIDAMNVGKVLTPRLAGMHIYIPATGRGCHKDLLPKIDYRGVGGYVVAPPSIITGTWADAHGATPGHYRWLGTPQLEQAETS